MKRNPTDHTLRLPLRSGPLALGLMLALGMSSCTLEESPGAWSPPSSPTSDDVEPTTEEPTTDDPLEASDLEGTWELETAYLQDAAGATGSDGRTPTLTFEADGSLAVDTGCNTGGGTYEVDGDQIRLSPIALTLRACDGPTGALEALVSSLLGADELSFRIEDSVLMLTAEDGTTLAFGWIDASDTGPQAGQSTGGAATETGRPTQRGTATATAPASTGTATTPADTGTATTPPAGQ